MNQRRWILSAVASVATALGALGCSSDKESSGLIVLDAIASVKINEALSRNNPPEGKRDRFGEFDDWIELINTGSEEAPLGGFWLSDNPNDPLKTALPSTIVLGAGKRLLVWADDQTYQSSDSEAHLGFRLGAVEGDDVVLSGPDGQPMDHIWVPPQPDDAETLYSTARCPDGSGPVGPCDEPTPDGNNNSSTCCAQED